MKRILQERKSRSLRKAALEQLRETRDKIAKNNPELLDEMRVKLEEAQKAQRPTVSKPKPAVATEKIDQTKNLQTVLTLLAMQPENEGLKQQLKEFLN
jgi:hypothetical protein